MGRLTRLTLSLSAAFTAGIIAGAGLIQHHVTHYQVVSSQTDSVARVIPWEARHAALAPTTTTTTVKRAPMTTTTRPPAPPTTVYTPPVTYVTPTTSVVESSPPMMQSTSSFQACVIQRESGGNPQIFSPSGTYWGAFQFSYSTWVANGGPPLDWGHAGFAEQQQVFLRSSPSNWSPYDGCQP